METPSRKFTRLLTALDQLVDEEAATLAEHDFMAVRAIQHRAEPLVSALAELGPEMADDLARARVAGLLARRQHSLDFLSSQLETARAELLAVQESSSRVAQFTPAYSRVLRPAAGTSRLDLAG